MGSIELRFLSLKNKKSDILLYHYIFKYWWIQGDSDPRPPRCERGALPAELWTRSAIYNKYNRLKNQLLIVDRNIN